MKRRYLALMLVVLMLVPAHAFAAITFFWRAEGTTLDGTADYSAGDTTATASGTPAINATAAIIGSNGIQVDSSADRYRFTNTSIITAAAGSVGFYINWQTFSAAGATWFYAQGVSFNDYVQVRGINTDELRLSIKNTVPGATVNLDTTAVNITTGSNYFVTISWDDAADLRRICVYNSGGTLVEACTVSSAAFDAPVDLTGTDNLEFGEANGFSTAYYLDNLFVGSAYADADTFYCNRNITTYASYAACSSSDNTSFFPRRSIQ